MTRWGTILWSLLILCEPVLARTYQVDVIDDTPDADPVDGNCADSDGRCSLRAAIMQANASPGHLDVVIHLPVGTFTLGIPGQEEDAAHTGDLDLHRRITLVGAGPGLTRIDAAALDRALDIHAGARVRLRQLAIVHGRLEQGASHAGAGVRVASQATLHMHDVDIRGHRMHGTAGGIALDSQGCVRGRRVRVLDNRDDDPALVADSATIHVAGPSDTACLMLEESEITGNTGGLAGALLVGPVAVSIERSLVSANTARAAGALHLREGAQVRLENVTVSGNRGDPGAVSVGIGARLHVVAGTVTGNGPRAGARASVGGIHDLHPGSGQTLLGNTVISGNGPGQLADDCAGVVSQGGSLFGQCVNLVASPGDYVGATPTLGLLRDNGGFTRSHLPGVNELDRGWNQGCPPGDQRETARPFDSDGDGVIRCDIGAVELPGEDPDFVVDTFVDTTDVDPGDGQCADAFGQCSLRAAIQETNAVPGAQRIVLPEGTYALTLPGRFEDAAAMGDLDISDHLILHGAGDALTHIDGGSLDRVIDIHVGSAQVRHVALYGLTLRNGFFAPPVGTWTDGGSGLRVPDSARVNLRGVTLRDNRNGTALHVVGRVSGERVRLLENGDDQARATVQVGDFTGGPCPASPDGEPDAELALVDCEISGNVAESAGAILSTCGRSTLRRCLVAHNVAGNIGAMMLDREAPMRLENVSLSGNAARGSGGIQNDGFSRLELFNSTVTGNGGIDGDLPNSSAIRDVHGGAGMVYLANTIVAGNSPIASSVGGADCNNGVSMGGNIIGDAAGCAQFAAQPNDQLDVVPALHALADNGGFTRTHRPLPGSVAIDRGGPEACLADDQRGLRRPQDGDQDGHVACDAGAVEVESDSLFVDGFETRVD